MLKTSVMMIGEFEFDDLFFDNPSDKPEVLPYSIFTMIFFLGFMIVMPILIMNLLVSSQNFSTFELLKNMSVQWLVLTDRVNNMNPKYYITLK